MIVMKEYVNCNFTIFQSVIYPEKSRQIFCKKYENKYFSPKAKLWEKRLKSDLISDGCSMDFFRNELVIKTGLQLTEQFEQSGKLERKNIGLALIRSPI